MLSAHLDPTVTNQTVSAVHRVDDMNMVVETGAKLVHLHVNVQEVERNTRAFRCNERVLAMSVAARILRVVR